MKHLILATLLILIVQSGSLAQTTTEELLHPMVSPPVIITTGKQPFKDKHPKIYKIVRKTRTVCVFLGPIAQFSANLTTALMQFI